MPPSPRTSVPASRVLRSSRPVFVGVGALRTSQVMTNIVSCPLEGVPVWGTSYGHDRTCLSSVRRRAVRDTIEVDPQSPIQSFLPLANEIAERLAAKTGGLPTTSTCGAISGSSTRFETHHGVLIAAPLFAWMPHQPAPTRELGQRSYDSSSRAIRGSTGPGSARGLRWSGPAAPASRRSLGPSPGLARPGFPARR